MGPKDLLRELLKDIKDVAVRGKDFYLRHAKSIPDKAEDALIHHFTARKLEDVKELKGLPFINELTEKLREGSKTSAKELAKSLGVTIGAPAAPLVAAGAIMKSNNSEKKASLIERLEKAADIFVNKDTQDSGWLPSFGTAATLGLGGAALGVGALAHPTTNKMIGALGGENWQNAIRGAGQDVRNFATDITDPELQKRQKALEVANKRAHDAAQKAAEAQMRQLTQAGYRGELRIVKGKDNLPMIDPKNVKAADKWLRQHVPGYQPPKLPSYDHIPGGFNPAGQVVDPVPGSKAFVAQQKAQLKNQKQPEAQPKNQKKQKSQAQQPTPQPTPQPQATQQVSAPARQQAAPTAQAASMSPGQQTLPGMKKLPAYAEAVPGLEAPAMEIPREKIQVGSDAQTKSYLRPGSNAPTGPRGAPGKVNKKLDYTQAIKKMLVGDHQGAKAGMPEAIGTAARRVVDFPARVAGGATGRVREWLGLGKMPEALGAKTFKNMKASNIFSKFLKGFLTKGKSASYGYEPYIVFSKGFEDYLEKQAENKLDKMIKDSLEEKKKKKNFQEEALAEVTERSMEKEYDKMDRQSYKDRDKRLSEDYEKRKNRIKELEEEREALRKRKAPALGSLAGDWKSFVKKVKSTASDAADSASSIADRVDKANIGQKARDAAASVLEKIDKNPYVSKANKAINELIDKAKNTDVGRALTSPKAKLMPGVAEEAKKKKQQDEWESQGYDNASRSERREMQRKSDLGKKVSRGGARTESETVPQIMAKNIKEKALKAYSELKSSAGKKYKELKSTFGPGAKLSPQAMWEAKELAKSGPAKREYVQAVPKSSEASKPQSTATKKASVESQRRTLANRYK